MQESRLAPSKREVRERLATLLTEIAKVPPEKITDSATIEEDLRLESVTFVELQVAIEEEYGIEVDPIRVVELNEFGAIVDYIHERAVQGAQ